MTRKQEASTSCVHKFQVDAQNIGTCSLCGERRQFPWDKGQDPVILTKGRTLGKRERWKRVRRNSPNASKNMQRHLYYKENREAIVADLLSLGRGATCAKWGIPQSTLPGLENRWLTEEQRAALPVSLVIPRNPPQPSAAASGDGRLPKFPEFSEDWPQVVKVTWLQVYGELATQK